MKLGSKIVLGGSLLLSILVAWYLFMKPYDYQIRFTKKTSPGALYKTVESWTMDMGTEITILNEKKKPFQKIHQNFKLRDSLLQFDWEFNSENDSITEVIVGIKDMEHSLSTRIKNLYSTPPLKQLSLAKIKDFNKKLDYHLKKFTVEIVGESEIPASFFAYIEAGCQLSQKATSMMSKNSEVLGWLKEHNIPIVALPSLEVTSWNIEKDSIFYNFQFPIQEVASMPYHDQIKFKKTVARKGLKAIFHGNYRISDRAWFSLLEYSKKNDIAIEETPIEFFFNNPMLGGDELEWKAEIYLPLKE